MTDEETFKHWNIRDGERIGDCWIGFWRVAYGWRVRAGHIADQWGCYADVCCGRDPSLMILVREVYAAKMKDNIAKDEDPFNGLLRVSDPKPCDKDESFMKHLNAIVDDLGESSNERADKIPAEEARESSGGRDADHDDCSICDLLEGK